MSEDLVREYEHIIDNGYMELPLFAMPAREAVYGVLAAFDSHIISERMVKRECQAGSLSIGQVQLFKFLGEGVNWALRWLLSNNYHVDTQPTISKNLIEQANALIEYGSKYHRATIFYSAYSQGSMEAMADPIKKLIRFTYNNKFIKGDGIWGFADEVNNQDAGKTALWAKKRDKLRADAAVGLREISHSFENGRIVIKNVGQLRDLRISRYVEWLTSYRHLFPSEVDLLPRRETFSSIA